MALRRAPPLPFSLHGISQKINGVAAVWEGCQIRSFDSAQTPFGINWQSSVKGSPASPEYVFAQTALACSRPSAKPEKGFIVNMPGLFTGCKINAVYMIGLGDGFIQLLLHILLVMWLFIKAWRHRHVHTEQIVKWSFSMKMTGVFFVCFKSLRKSVQSSLMNMSHL